MPLPGNHHHAGLQHDIDVITGRLHARRQVLGWLVGGGVTALTAACGGSSDTTSATGTSNVASAASTVASAGTACVADPEETNGPFPSDGTNSANGSVSNALVMNGIVRSDIRSSFGSSTTVAEGVPLTLTLTLADSNTACSQLIGYAIYVWHCNRSGEYSLYGADILDENYLRGVQVTDGNGQVTFETIFPACYSGRFPHIHVEVYTTLADATNGKNAIFTTQMAMPEAIASTVYLTATGYGASVQNLAQVSLATDNVFDSSTSAQLTAQTPTLSGDATSGYTGSITIGVGV
jgi:protocatechuate 3,4-dioxygenase beta subunit